MREALRLALAALEDKKAFDIVLLDISKVASFASYFLMCSGDSSRQIQAIADEVEKKLKENGIRPNHIEGYRHAEWILLDYVDVVVHIFSKSARAYYDLERLWRDGKRLDAQKLLNTRARKVPASSRK
jgi:ribosome-associated protein